MRKRRCWNCNNLLDYEDFKSTNRLNYTDKEIKAVWENSKLQFYCCSCYQFFYSQKQLIRIIMDLFPRKCTICHEDLRMNNLARFYQLIPVNFITLLWENRSIDLYCANCLKNQKNQKEYKKRLKILQARNCFYHDNISIIEKNKKYTKKMINSLPGEEKHFLRDVQEEINLIPPYISNDKATATFGFSIGKNGRISKLFLSSCNLTFIPDSIGNLPSLKKLDFSKNYLETLPSSIGNLISLEELHLNDNEIAHLPSSLKELKKLKHLNLWRNKLSDVPTFLSTLNSLRYLNLSYNYLYNLPECLGKLTKLKYIYIIGNLIKEVPDSLMKLTDEKLIIVK